ncbi:helix-turn-helix transcriptional regulator [Arenimonas fontis]|uniref:Helix-turn-helix transcriptional regulator n=1 Tax=Arenimonas fontis TaxID=2608255 RepID=A0A5B2Z9W8_9GAMM|nr:helix-turn-helix transcriptional regulator [Arenimonas fontis]KAA2285448.1 helix-turn-helix transcriptional regulator [Arenimonas fontis]
MSTPLAERLVFARESSGFANTKRAAEAAGITPSALYQLESGKTKSLAGDTAEKLARIYPKFRIEWLISGRGHPTYDEAGALAATDLGSSPSSHDLGISAERLSASIKLIRLACEQLDVPFDPEDDGDLIVLAYQYLQGLAESSVTPENLVDFTKRLRQKARGTIDASESSEPGEAGSGTGRKSRSIYSAKF